MGSSWTLLTLFLVYSYPNERLGLLSRRLLEPLSKVSACSRPPLGSVYATPTERLYYAYATQNYRATLDIATIAQQISFFITKALSLPSPYQRPCYDLPTIVLCYHFDS